MRYYKLVPVLDNSPFGVKPDVPVGTNYEARSYDMNANTCKVKTLRDEVLSNGVEITKEEYLGN